MRLISTFLALLLTTSAWATIPASLDYQGYLTDRDGSPENGDVLIKFSIYTVEVGGTFQWTDKLLVEVENGLFSVELGRPANPFPVDLFETPLWLGIQVEADSEMIPRRALTSVGFSFKADDADSLQGKSSADLDQSPHVNDLGNPHGVTASQIDAATSTEIANLQAQLDGAIATIATLQGAINDNFATIASVQADLANEIADRIADVDAEETMRLAADGLHDSAITDIQANSVLALDGLLTLEGDNTALFEGVNVQVVNGTGTTDGEPNGRGNVIVGYDEVDTDPPICSRGNAYDQNECETYGGLWASSHKSGSHNVVIGANHNYSRFGGFVVGKNSNITGDWSSVSGGTDNTALETGASVSAGQYNIAGEIYASVSGGLHNQAGAGTPNPQGGDRGSYSNITGGESNSITAPRSGTSAILGGSYNSIGPDTHGSVMVGGNGNDMYQISAVAISSSCIDSGSGPSYSICAGAIRGADLSFSSLSYSDFSDGGVSDSFISSAVISDSFVSGNINADSFGITPSSVPPSAYTGDIYIDDSSALCVYLDGAWIRVAGTGSCE